MSAATLQLPRIAPNWRTPALAVFALLVLLLLSFRDTAVAMVEIWSRSETFTHAYVVPPIVAWLIWRRRAELSTLSPRPAPWMAVPMVLLAALWWLGKLAAANAAMQLALTAMLVASVPMVLGWQVARALTFPLAFLFFAVPIGEFLTPLLMRLTADFVVGALQVTGIPVYREGQQLVIPSGRWSVIEACSGIRYLMASFMVGSLFAYLNYQTTRRRVIFVALSLIVPIVANWLRAYIIVMLGHLSDNRIATGVDHIIYGWVFFGIVIMALFFIGARWAEPDAPLPVAAPLPPLSAAASRRAAWWPAAIAVLALLAVQWPLWLVRGDAATASLPVRLEMPQTLGDWRVDEAISAPWKPEYIGAAAQHARVYRSAQGMVGLHVAYYRGQSENAKLISSVNQIVTTHDDDWNTVARGHAVAPVDGQPQSFQSTRLLGAERTIGGQRAHLTVWRLFWVGGQLTDNEYLAKAHEVWLRMRGEADDGAAVMLYSIERDSAAADRLLAGFVAAHFGSLQQSLARARDQR